MTLGYIVSAIIGAGAVLLGVIITGSRERRLRIAERDERRRAELKQAMQEYLAALDAVMLESEDFPVPPRLTRADEWVFRSMRGTVVELVFHIALRLLKRLVYGHRHDDLSDRLVAAAAHLRLVATPTVEEYMREVETLGSGHKPGDEQWTAQWKDFRSGMRQGFKKALGE